jgi:hypothetical protein
MNMTKTATEFGQELLETIKSKDAQQSITKVQQFREGMRDKSVGAEYVLWITEPVNLTSVQKALAEDLEVPQRVLAIKRAVMSRTQKAVLLVQAMEMGIKKVHKL